VQREKEEREQKGTEENEEGTRECGMLGPVKDQ
jgi:hypothetical protein